MTNIGHNQPPSPFDEVSEKINDLYIEAQNWLDGSGVQSETDAENVGKLLTLSRDASKVAEAARVAEKKSFDDGAKAVQEKYKPILDRAKLITDMCKKTLAPWIEKLEVERQAKEQAARKEAEEKAMAAQKAMQESNDIAAREQAEIAVKEAKKAEAAASAISKQKSHIKGVGRAIGARTSYYPVLEDLSAAVKHYWAIDRKAFEELVVKMATQDVRGGNHKIPGFRVEAKKDVA